MTIRITPKVMDKVQKVAHANGRAINRQIELMLADGVGMYGLCPIIVGAADTYYWISPYGTYGELNATIFRRFCSSGFVPLGADDWDDAFDSIDECIKALGKPICTYSERGLTILNYRQFEKLVMTYQG